VRKKILLALAVCLSALIPIGITASPTAGSSAAAEFNPFFNTPGWYWQAVSGNNTETKYQYDNYPIPCNTTPSAKAWQVLWVYKEGASLSIPAEAYAAVKRANSIFAASARKQVSTYAQVKNTSRSVRWVTNPGAEGELGCSIRFHAVQVPAAIYTGDMGYLIDYLTDVVGADQPNRKYLAIKQTNTAADGGTGGFTGCDYDLNHPGLDNAANGTGISLVFRIGIKNGNGHVAAHEMTHCMGAMNTDQPHYNSKNHGHPTDCGDLLCYGSFEPGETWKNGCGTEYQNDSVLVPFVDRLDCNQDDYWDPFDGSGTWEQTRWNVYKSSFLWGNP